MVPGFQNFMLPFLQCLSDGKEHTLKEMVEKISTILNLTEQDKVEQLPSQRQSQVANRTSWSKTYLQKAGLLTQVTRGTYKITKEGELLLQKNPKKIDIPLLKQYPSFVEFQKPHKQDVTPATEIISETIETPEELMHSAYQEIRSSLASQLLDMVKAQSPQFFEHLVIRLLVAMGYGGSFEDAASVTKYSHDDGIDGVIKEDKLGLDSIYIQAKRYTTGSVQKPDMQKFIGALSEKGAIKGIFITTSSFSSGAIETSKNAKNVKMVLIDGEKLAKYMIDYNIGVAVEATYEIKRIDSDYFEQ